jgi:hypothetical protein
MTEVHDYRNMNPTTAPLVRIDWEDICFSDNWNDDGDVQPLESSTTGYLIFENLTMVVVAGSYNWRDNTWATIHTIPKLPPTVVVIKEAIE